MQIEDKRTWSQKLFGNVLKCGPVPRHVAIIMDGNRRYAKNRHIDKIEGHKSGFEKLFESLNWCIAMGIHEVTVYAFSIENFKRSANEVNALFDLAKEKFKKIIEEKDKLNEVGVCIRVFGSLFLLPKDLQHIIAKMIEISKNNKAYFMNVCIAYTSREEMTMAVRDICSGIKEEKIELSDINEDLLEKCLYTSHSPIVDLLVRTSGEVRLSDFLLWQSDSTTLSFIKQLWPELNIWNFYMGIMHYQINYSYIQKVKSEQARLVRESVEIACKMNVIENRKELVDKIKSKEIEDVGDLHNVAKHVAVEAVEMCIKQYDERTSCFLDDLYDKRVWYVHDLSVVVE